MAKLQKKFIADSAVGTSQIKLENDSYLLGRNNGDDGDINLLKVTTSDLIEFGLLPYGPNSNAPTADAQLANKKYVDDQVASAGTAAEWQDSALDYITDNTAAPPTEVSGDRYILSHDGGAPNAGWDGASAGDIVEFNGSTWDATTPSTGTFISADDDTTGLYYWGGAAWTFKQWENTTASTGLTKVGSDIRLADAAASNGIQVSSGAISAVVDDSSIEISGNSLQVKALGITNAMLAGSIADGKLAADYIQTSEVDDSTIEFNGGSLNVKASGIGETELNNVDGGVDAESFVLTSGYTKGAGTVAAADTIEAAIEKLDGNVDAKLGTALTSANIFVGNGSNVATGVAMSGDVAIDNAGATTIQALAVENSMLAGSIADSKLNQITTADKVAGSAVQLNASGALEDNSGLQINIDSTNNSTAINGSNEITALRPINEELALDATDISNGYKDLSNVAYSAASISVTPLGGILQDQGTDYTISLTGGAGGVTRVTFAGDLSSELANGDILAVSYEYM
jgi:hypothetical protein